MVAGAAAGDGNSRFLLLSVGIRGGVCCFPVAGDPVVAESRPKDVDTIGVESPLPTIMRPPMLLDSDRERFVPGSKRGPTESSVNGRFVAEDGTAAVVDANWSAAEMTLLLRFAACGPAKISAAAPSPSDGGCACIAAAS